MKNLMKVLTVSGISAAAVLLGPEALASASTTTTTVSTGGGFDGLWTTLSDLSSGAYGKSMALLFVIVGTAIGIARQSLMSFAIGGGAAVGVSAAPSVIENSLFTASHVATEAVKFVNSTGLVSY